MLLLLLLVVVVLVLMWLTVRREIAIGFMSVIGRGRGRRGVVAVIVVVEDSRGGLAKGVSFGRDL